MVGEGVEEEEAGGERWRGSGGIVGGFGTGEGTGWGRVEGPRR